MGRSTGLLVLSASTQRISREKNKANQIDQSRKSFIGLSFVDTKTVESYHVLLQSISATIWLIADGAEVFANNMLCFHMPECVGFLDVTIITLTTEPNQFSHLTANWAHLRKDLHVNVCTNLRVTLVFLLLNVQINMPCLLFMWAFNLSLRVYEAGQIEHCIEKSMCFCSMWRETSDLEARQKPQSRQCQAFLPSSSLRSSSRGSIRASTS